MVASEAETGQEETEKLAGPCGVPVARSELCPAAAAPSPSPRGAQDLSVPGASRRGSQKPSLSSFICGSGTTQHCPQVAGPAAGVRGGAVPAHQGSPPRPSGSSQGPHCCSPRASGNNSLTTDLPALPTRRLSGTGGQAEDGRPLQPRGPSSENQGSGNGLAAPSCN